MNNLPLQPLVWFERKDSNMYGNIKHCAQGAGIFYTIMPTSKDVEVYWGDSIDGSSGHRTLRDVADAKEWVKTDHYPSKMQPYIKPMPTWIDVSERLPERKELLTDKDKCLVLTECGKVWTGFYNTNIKPDDWYLHGWTEKQGWHPFKIVAWMLASEFSTMQNNKGE